MKQDFLSILRYPANYIIRRSVINITFNIGSDKLFNTESFNFRQKDIKLNVFKYYLANKIKWLLSDRSLAQTNFCYLAHFEKADACRRIKKKIFDEIRRKVAGRKTAWEGGRGCGRVALSVQSSSYFPLSSRRWKKAKKRREWLVGSRRQDSSNIAASQSGDVGRGGAVCQNGCRRGVGVFFI